MQTLRADKYTNHIKFKMFDLEQFITIYLIEIEEYGFELIRER